MAFLIPVCYNIARLILKGEVMAYYIGQILGILVTVGAVVNLQLKNKKHMFILSIAVNLLSSLNILLVDQWNSGVIICAVAVIQLLFSLWHDKKGTKANLPEKIFFVALYVGGGLLGYNAPIDILSIVAAILYMVAMFQKKEQNIRLFLLANMSCWTVYHLVIGSTAIFAQIAGIISSLIAMYRYRKK